MVDTSCTNLAKRFFETLLKAIIVSLLYTMNINASSNPPQLTSAEETLRYTLERLCQQEPLTFNAIDISPIESRGRVIGQLSRYSIAHNDELQVEHIKPADKTLSYRLTYIKNKKQPLIFVATDYECNIRVARRIIYNKQIPKFLQILEADLSTVTREEAINPAVPVGTDPRGVRVGIIDSGVNYLLPEISKRLARDSDDNIIGYDFWDLDATPYDYNPARSVFFPQRHGTRTASLLIKEAPGISLIPYRYPRPDMSRMVDLIKHAAKHDAKIIAMPLGSKNKEEWLTFLQAAKTHSEILFIISSGNNGFDIDEIPIYPAAFQLENSLVVSSADETPRPASRTNWGKNNTDILLPAERQKTTDFDGQQKIVSGTSYAVSRVAALAARFKKRYPDWSTKQLKQAILNLADRNLAKKYTTYGLLYDPLIDTSTVNIIEKPVMLSSDKQMTNALLLKLNVVILKSSGWTITQATQAARQAMDIYSYCNINLQITLTQLEVSDYLQDFHSLSSRTLIEKTKLTAPAIYLVKDTRRLEAFSGEAFGNKNSKNLLWLKNTAWLIAGQKDPGITLAHELFHILVDNGNHNIETNNLMNSETKAFNTQLTTTQCNELKTSKFFHD
ncbi:MAG: S8 family serine peptidase [Gammaproteobacteria bacterium]|nr:S8 family serine peptidase [Gammaproteobacteria bacterium]